MTEEQRNAETARDYEKVAMRVSMVSIVANLVPRIFNMNSVWLSASSVSMYLKVSKMYFGDIVANLVLTVFKLLAGVIAHSGAMISDAIHSASDVFSFFQALRPKDIQHELRMAFRFFSIYVFKGIKNVFCRDILTAINDIANQKGNYDWGLAIHPYPNPLTRVNYWTGS